MNISTELQDVLEQCRKKEDLPCELHAALRDKCRVLGVHFNLLPLETKFCERIMTPSASHNGSMISSLSEITGFSPTGFIGKGTKYVTANGQKVSTPATVNQLFDMIGHTWAYTRIERNQSIIAAKYESLFAGLLACFGKNSISRNQGNLNCIPDFEKTRGHYYKSYGYKLPL